MSRYNKYEVILGKVFKNGKEVNVSCKPAEFVSNEKAKELEANPLRINKKNLKRMVEYLKTLHDDELDMSQYSEPDYLGSEYHYTIPLTHCNSVGCVIGHCVHLDDASTISKYLKVDDDELEFNYLGWSMGFVFMSDEEPSSLWGNYTIKNLHHYYDEHVIWEFMFSDKWENCVKSAINRIEYVIEYNSVPDWFDEFEFRVKA